MSESKIIKVAILATENSILSTIASPMDMFLQAGVLWNVTMGERPSPLFDVKIVTANGRPVNALNNIPVHPNCGMLDIEHVDLIIIPSQGFLFNPNDEDHLARVEWLTSWYHRGADLASVCGGAFTLAATGLLDGKSATTHWGLTKQFVKSYPKVNLRTDLLVTDEGRLFCGGGISADLNLSLYLIEKYCGREVALQSSRCTMVDLDCVSQSPFTMFTPEKNHGDSIVLNAQNRMAEQLAQQIDVEQLAENTGLSSRQFNRRFKSATGESVNSYLQLLRIDEAKKFLVNTNLSFEDISIEAGYENISYFRRIFKKQTTLTPAEYRKRFK